MARKTSTEFNKFETEFDSYQAKMMSVSYLTLTGVKRASGWVVGYKRVNKRKHDKKRICTKEKKSEQSSSFSVFLD